MLQALVVEDELALQILYSRILEKSGFQVLTANDGNEAISILQEIEPNLLLLDIRMPNANGLAVIDFVRNANFRQMHIVVATATKEYERYINVLPSAQFLLKPVLPPQLIEIADTVHQIAKTQAAS
jgi:chemosensory pili system protein ChpA (sensor histidine kinase/response regulator)